MILPITVCIPALNEEANLPSCLNSLGDAFARVLVIDSGSNDETQQIAKSAGAAILNFQWNGKFPKKRNWALQNHHFETPWVLFLDADERITPEFISELSDVLPETTHSGFWMFYDNWFMGKRLRHGDTMSKLALFRIGSGEYERFPEDSWSHLDMEVHEHPVIEGSIGRLTARLEHHDFRGLKHYISKHNEYSTWEANRFRWLSCAGEAEWAKLNERQTFKYRNLNRWWLSWLYWFVSYILKKGFLDGKVGWRFASLKRRYFCDIQLKIDEDLKREPVIKS
ncbi:MAG: glycosyltransferase family 2 protein [Akkermansiaceae bacterium]